MGGMFSRRSRVDMLRACMLTPLRVESMPPHRV